MQKNVATKLASKYFKQRLGKYFKQRQSKGFKLQNVTVTLPA